MRNMQAEDIERAQDVAEFLDESSVDRVDQVGRDEVQVTVEHEGETFSFYTNVSRNDTLSKAGDDFIFEV